MRPALFPPTRRFMVKLAGQVFDEWTRVEVSRDLEDMAGKFSLELRDSARSWASWPFATLAGMARLVEVGLEIEILLDGRSILQGWVNTVAPSASEGQVSVTIDGCDKTADLCDCAASVDGPFEHYGLTIDKVAEQIVKPYGLKIKVEADVGKAFPRYALDVAETGLSAIEKGARQRGLLLTSDGRDGLVLTQSGRQRSSGKIVFPGNAFESSGNFTMEGRHSEVHVKGQAERAGGRRRPAPRLDVRKAPTIPQPDELVKWLGQQLGHEAGGTAVYGKAVDAVMKRYRPLVAMGRTQLSEEGARTQAEWMGRTSRGRCEGLDYSVKDYYATEGQLWRPNELVSVEDSFQNVFRDMLIAGVAYGYDDQSGACTRLRISGPDAYDMAPEGGRRKNSKSKKTGPLDGNAEPLTRD